MESLYDDIFYKICKYLSIKDISNLQNTNVDIYRKIQCLHNNIMLRELQRFTYGMTDVKILKDNFYMYLISFLKQNNTHSFRFLHNNTVSNIYNRILTFYLKSNNNQLLNLDLVNHENLDNYPNKLEMLVLYNFINMECFTNLYNRGYLFDFLKALYTRKNIIDDIFYNLKYNYYNYTFHVENYTPYFIKCSFDELYQMLPYITSISVLKKLFGFRIFDLTHTKLFLCCEECVIGNIYYICDLKNNFWKDDLICHNYLEIVNFLKREKKIYYNILIQREKYLVDNKIYLTNPNTNRIMRLNSSYFRKLKFEFEDIYLNLDRMLYNQRKRLIKKYFR